MDRDEAHTQAVRLGDLYEELRGLLIQAKVSRSAHTAAILRLIRQYGRENVAKMLQYLENDMKGTP